MAASLRSHNFLSILLSIFLAALFVVMALSVSATSKDDIVYPIAELGGCKNEKACRAYCDERGDVSIIKACIAFAKKHNLLPAEVIARGERFIGAIGDADGGPGGCVNEETCTQYCENIAHIQECVAFAEKFGALSPDELGEAKKVASALRAGAKLPGNCTGRDNCLAYCENPAHLDECIAFAEKSGILPPDELAEAKKFAPLIKSGKTPGSCASKAQCDAYCSDDAHFDECVSFAKDQGFMSAREAELAKKSKGKTPGNCGAGARRAEEAREKCAAYCNDPGNQAECFRFAAEMGFISAEEASSFGSLSDFQACLPQAPDEVRQCLEANLDAEILIRLQRGEIPGDLEEVEKMITQVRKSRSCLNRYADASLQTFTDDSDALSCVNNELGEDFVARARAGQVTCGQAAGVQTKVRACIEDKLGKKLDSCFSLACSEAITCIQGIGDKSEKYGEGDVSPELQKRIDDKIGPCIEELKKAGGGGADGGEGPSRTGAPSAEEIQRRTQDYTQQQTQEQTSEQQKEEYQKQYQAEYDRQYKEQLQSSCPLYSAAPNCAYFPAGSEDRKNCKICFPDK